MVNLDGVFWLWRQQVVAVEEILRTSYRGTSITYNEEMIVFHICAVNNTSSFPKAETIGDKRRNRQELINRGIYHTAVWLIQMKCKKLVVLEMT